MKKTSSMFIVLIVAVMIISSPWFNFKAVNAETPGYSIAHVDHRIEVMYNGYVLMNDTVEITGQVPASFLVGFPYKYGQYVLRAVAYDAVNASDFFNVTLDDHSVNRIGFYWIKIDFPGLAPTAFTVGVVLSNQLLNVSTANSYVLNFPAYPSLTETTADLNATILLPQGATNVTVTKQDGIVNGTTYKTENLSAFTYSNATVSFVVTGGQIAKLDVVELRREITVTGLDQIAGSDRYSVMNEEPITVNSTMLVLPSNASNLVAYDLFGRYFTTPPSLVDQKTNRYQITFNLPLEANKSTIFTLNYNLPSNFIKQEGANNFNLTLPLFENVNYYIEQVSVTVVLPEGARISSLENPRNYADYGITRTVFQETVALSRQGVFSLDSFNMGILYSFNALWVSGLPTVWMSAIALVGCAIVFVWKRPGAPAKVVVPERAMRPSVGVVRSFVDAYEEKRKILSDIASLESRVQKGKIPRRRYKVQRITLEARLNTLNRNLTEFGERALAVGGHYTEMMRQLEVAETEINEVEANMKSIEARHSRGELSLEAYRKLLSDYQRRKERAETTIDGILFRFREEIG